MTDEKELRNKVINSAVEYYRNIHGKPKNFMPGDKIPYAARVFDETEITNLIDSALDFWLTMGKYTYEFEKKFAEFLNVKYCSSTNSGSSANLLAFMALTSHELGRKRIMPGDEVITVAAGFPTTIAPIIQYGAIPVFADISVPAYNIDVSTLQEALSPKTKAVMLAHTLGNPFDLREVMSFCKSNNLWLIEDNCDALGSRYFLENEWRYTGTIGDIGTSSFYPPHHMTMGEGGAVYTNNKLLNKLINSFRDWGRDCCCPSGVDNMCNNRFSQKFGELPFGYDHKYVYSHFGYNLKATEMQASIGCAQLEKLKDFISARKANWQFLRKELNDLADFFILPEPEASSDPSWFGFVLTVSRDAPFSRNGIVRFLEQRGIQTRMLFAGNITKHPCFDEMREYKRGYKVIGNLANTDLVMNNTFWVGVYPGMTQNALEYIILCIKEYCGRGTYE